MTFRAAVIGTGFIGPVHVEGLRRAGVNVVGILGSSAAKSVDAAKKLNIRQAYQDIDELLADERVDCVHVTSPNQAHFEQTTKCLKAGKHVVCEKPLAMDSTQSQQLVTLARESGKATAVNYNIRYYPLCLEAAEQRRSGELGDIYHVTGSYVQDWLSRSSDFNWRVLSQAGGPLRAVADIGTHWLDLVHAITGLEVQSLCADLQTVHPRRQCPVGGVETFSGKLDRAQQPDDTYEIDIDTEDFGSVLIQFVGGARGVLHVSQVTAGRKNCLRVEVAGSKQALSWNSECPNELWIGHRDSRSQLLQRDPALMHYRAAKFANYPGGHNEGFPDTFKQLFTDFYGSIEDESYLSNPKYPTFEDGHREIVLCEAILRSAEQRCWIDI